MMRMVPISLALLLPAAAPASPIAEVICEETPRMATRLGPLYGPAPHAVAVRGPDQTLEVWRAESGDWALVARYATGASCLLAMGQHWEEMQPEAAEES